MPKEGWLRCADCHARVYEGIYEELLKIKSPSGREQLTERLESYEADIKLRLSREKRGQNFERPSEDTCIFCFYEEEYKEDYENDKIQVIKTFNKFHKKLKNRYM